MNKLNRFYLSQNISIDNALSTNQILHQIVNQIKEIVDFINNLELRANEYTDQEILKLKNDLEGQLQTLEQTLKTYTDNSISTYNAEVINPQLEEIKATINRINTELNNRIDNEVGILNRKIDSVESSLIVMLNETKEYLEDLIRKGNQLVYSGVSGLKIPIQDALKEIANASKQMLSYNWNTIDLLKNYTISVDLTDYDSYGIGNDEIYYNTIDLGASMEVLPFVDGDDFYLRIKSQGPQLGYYTIYLNDVNKQEYFNSSENSIDIPLNDLESDNILNNLTFETSSTTRKLYIYKNPIDISMSITFDTLKSQMQNTDIEIRPNWNGLVFDGVNGWNILASVGGLYDDDSVVNPLWNELPYKNNVYRNENSNFYNQIEVEGE